MEINSSMKREGWKKMQNLLDKKMPAKEKKFFFIPWFTLLWLGTGFVAGFLFNQQILNPQADKPLKTEKTIQTNQPNALEKPVAIITNRNEKYRSSRIVSTNDFINSGRVLNPGFANPNRSNKPGLGRESEIDQENVAGAILTNVTKDTPSPLEIFNNFSFRDIAALHALPMPKTVFESVIPGITSVTQDKSNEFFNRQNISLMLGTTFDKSPTPSLSFAYQMGHQIGKFTGLANLGYRYYNGNIREQVDTIGYKNNFSQDQTGAKEWQVNQLHQLTGGLGLRYDIGKAIYLETGTNVSFNVSNPASSSFLSLETKENQSPTTGGNINNSVNETPSRYYRRWNLFPYLGLGIKVSDRWSISATLQRALRPLNSVPLLNSSDYRLSSGSIGIQYFL